MISVVQTVKIVVFFFLEILGQETEVTDNTQGDPTVINTDIDSARLLYQELINCDDNTVEKVVSAEVMSKISEHLEYKR